MVGKPEMSKEERKGKERKKKVVTCSKISIIIINNLNPLISSLFFSLFFLLFISPMNIHTVNETPVRLTK